MIRSCELSFHSHVAELLRVSTRYPRQRKKGLDSNPITSHEIWRFRIYRGRQNTPLDFRFTKSEHSAIFYPKVTRAATYPCLKLLSYPAKYVEPCSHWPSGSRVKASVGLYTRMHRVFSRNIGTFHCGPFSPAQHEDDSSASPICSAGNLPYQGTSTSVPNNFVARASPDGANLRIFAL